MVNSSAPQNAGSFSSGRCEETTDNLYSAGRKGLVPVGENKPNLDLLCDFTIDNDIKKMYNEL